jgi:hypothetical protein
VPVDSKTTTHGPRRGAFSSPNETPADEHTAIFLAGTSKKVSNQERIQSTSNQKDRCGAVPCRAVPRSVGRGAAL